MPLPSALDIWKNAHSTQCIHLLSSSSQEDAQNSFNGNGVHCIKLYKNPPICIHMVCDETKNQSHWMAHNVIIHLKCTKCVCNGSWLRWILYNFDVVNYVEWPWTRHSSKYISSSSKNRLKWMQVFTLKSRRLTPSPLSPLTSHCLEWQSTDTTTHSLRKKKKNRNNYNE